MKKKYLIFRILGNDLQGLHGNNQTIQNLEFTLINEEQFPDTDKIFLLNRIYDKEKKKEITNLLDKYKYKYIDIPFSLDEFKKIKRNKKLNIKIKKALQSKNKFQSYIEYLMNYEVKQRKYFLTTLYESNLYLININNARNLAVNYGKSNDYDWTFVLDSNSYFTPQLFNSIINNINIETEYIAINQIRLSDNNINNDQLLNNNLDLSSFTHREPQLAFKKTSTIVFNDKIPYGTSEKAELIRVFNIPGPWNIWKDNELYLNIKDRKVENVNYQILSKVIRLNPHNITNNFGNNFMNRIVGLNNLINQIRNNNNFNE